MRLESLCCTWKLAFHIAFGALNIVSEDVESCPIALRLNSHCFSPFVESQGTACAVLARARQAVLIEWRATAGFAALGANGSPGRGMAAILASRHHLALPGA